jgi:multidrug efflux pump
LTSIQLPADATVERTLEVVKAYEQHAASRPSIRSNMTVVGFGFSGSGQNAAMAFTMLKDWGERNGATAQGEVSLAQTALSGAIEGTVITLLPPPSTSLATAPASPCACRIGPTRAMRAPGGRDQAACAGAKESTRQRRLCRQPSSRLQHPPGHRPGQGRGVGRVVHQISDTLSTAMGSHYVNDFPNDGRMQQVIIQAEASARMQIDDVLKLYVRNADGGMMPLSEVVTPAWSETPLQLVRYQGFPAARISGNAAPGVSSGEAMAEMERLAAQLPPGFAVAWTGQSLQERQSATQAPLLMALSILVVFLVLAALYESWTIPLSVMLVVPLGLLGAVGAVMLRGMPNDVFFKVGMITVIGLSAKNAILIIELAKQLRQQGKGLAEAAVTAARLRLRPILMTSLAFGLGVVPLMLASGASAETQHAIGTGVFGGMVTATVLAIFFVPVFFVFVMALQERFAAWRSSCRSSPK